MQLGLLAAAAASLLAQAPIAERYSSRPTDWPPCRMTHRATFFRRLEDMPAPIQEDFRRRVGRVAASGDAFNPGDDLIVGDTTPGRRFLRGVRSGLYWFIWYEHGGLALHRHVLAYSITVNGTTYYGPDRVRPVAAMETHLVSNLTGDPCRATDAVVDGVFESDEF